MYVHRVLRALLRLEDVLFIKPPPILDDCTDSMWRWFKGCLGAIDGTYIEVIVPESDKPSTQRLSPVVNLSSSPTSVVILPYLSICHRHRRRHPSPVVVVVVVVPHLSSSSSSSSSLTCRRHRPSPVVVIVVIVVLTCHRPSPASDDLSLAFYHSLTVTDRQRQIANDR
ncbi:hypothetical protein Ddye_006512 [Dipteronia dyeriana]|uniref:Uncharacterized protein n=1 Tax=Dipteronia dyeriana TaxID=168575 RepID=A0AAE0CQR5_9ROSI|nr:hypothetical protein Ddye_006512 [Dipteronia dyeriana]